MYIVFIHWFRKFSRDYVYDHDDDNKQKKFWISKGDVLFL